MNMSPHHSTNRFLAMTRTTFGVFLCVASPGWADTTPSGEAIYRQQCASCHGTQGEGTADVPDPLVGDRPVDQLIRIIHKRMPQEDPELCVGADAEAVAAYIYDAFYSPAAQARNRPARIEFSRLTVRQYRQAVTDLIGTFRSDPQQSSDQQGLQSRYYNSRRIRGRSNLDRIDPQVAFDFGTGSPDSKVDATEFSIRWEGSVIAPETGDYDFVVRTDHAARLWVNDEETPLIDAWVKSGSDTEFHGSIFLLGGRAYPIQLEFSKAKQGVDDSDKNPPKEDVPAFVSLNWQLPHRAEEPIPSRCLFPVEVPEVFVVNSPFPPDDRTAGYERGTSVSAAWDLATTDAAIEVANYVAENLGDLAGGRDDRRYREFAQRFTERAFRRPLSDEQRQFFIDAQFDAAPDAEAAIKRVVLLTLKSPRFLYREIGGSQDPYDVASRLSFSLWDSLPDRELLDAAAAGKLTTRDELAHHAERMVNDPRTRAKVMDFLHQWLKVDPVPDLGKDSERFPEFNEVIASDLRTSLDLFLDDIIFGEHSDFRELFLADSVYLNGRLAEFYDADLAADTEFQRVALDPGVRAGVMSHPYLLATLAYTETSSPIHRGVLLARGMLGRGLRPPPEAFTPLAPDLHPELTTRERVTLQTSPASCMACHGMINSLGFALEQFDAAGRFRETDNGKPIDASGVYQTVLGDTIEFQGAKELGEFLASSPEVHDAFVLQLFHYLVKQPLPAYGSETAARLRQEFLENEFDVRKLIVAIVTETALRGRNDSVVNAKP